MFFKSKNNIIAIKPNIVNITEWESANNMQFRLKPDIKLETSQSIIERRSKGFPKQVCNCDVVFTEGTTIS